MLSIISPPQLQELNLQPNHNRILITRDRRTHECPHPAPNHPISPRSSILMHFETAAALLVELLGAVKIATVSAGLTL